MCGLTAIFSTEPSLDIAARVRAMLDLLRHRGPDDREVVAFTGDRLARPHEPATIAFGHQRLAIIDLSPAGRQPMADSTGRFWLSFNGEIYNHLELASELRAAHVTSLRSHCDTEVLVELWAREQQDCLHRLDGMFAFLVVDLPLRRAYAVRDRFGIKPLYFWWASPDELVFASEIKAFTAHPLWRPRMNGQRVADFLARGVIDHTNETLFENIHQVPPGHWMEIDFSGRRLPTRTERWYSISSSAAPDDPREQARMCLDLLRRSVQRHLRADVTVGSCLSGGLDSSTMVCLASESLRAGDRLFTQKTFTARSDEASIDEWPLAREIAAAATVEAIAVEPDGRSLLDDLEHFVWIQDEPFGSPSIFLQHEVFRVAAAHGVKVMLDGQGADEQFAGYHAFFGVQLADQMRRGHVREFAHWMRRLHELHHWPVRRALGQALAGLLAAPARTMLRARSPHAIGLQLIDHWRMGASSHDPFDALAIPARSIREFSIQQLTAASLPMLLHWEDRNSMAHSIEARVPFLSHELVEFALALPPEAKLHDGVTKHMLREAMSGIVPDAVRLRTDKIAFAAPEARWLLRDHRTRTLARLENAIDSLSDILAPGAPDALAAIAHARRPYDNALWRVICVAAWRNCFNVRAS